MKTVSLRMPRPASPAPPVPIAEPSIAGPAPAPVAPHPVPVTDIPASEFVAGFILGALVASAYVVLPCIQRHPCCRGEAMATAIVILLHVAAVELAIVAIHHYLRTGRFGPKE